MRRYCKKKIISSSFLATILTALLLSQNAFPQAEAGPSSEEPQIEQGEENILIDSVGYLLSTPKRLILLNPNIDTHRISPKTEQYIKDFISDNPELMKDTKVRINQWTPVGEFKRLVDNKKVSWWWRVFPGVPVTLLSSLTGRLLGGDHYNPYTDTIHVYSDDPSVVLHEVAHAKDFSKKAREDRMTADLYTIGRILPPVTLNQEYIASHEAIDYLRKKKDRNAELSGYSTLTSAYGTYLGGYSDLPYGEIVGAGVGHVAGFFLRQGAKASYYALDNAVIGDEVIVDIKKDPVAKCLLEHKEDIDSKLAEAFLKDQDFEYETE